MKIAYLILAHKNPGQLARLIAALSRPESVFYVHIDRKVKEEPFRRALQTFGADTIFVRERHTVSRGGFSIVEATLSLIRDCLAGADKVDRAVLLSGQDYPIKSCNQILQFFEESREQEFIEHFDCPPRFGAMTMAEWIESGITGLLTACACDIHGGSSACKKRLASPGDYPGEFASSEAHNGLC